MATAVIEIRPSLTSRAVYPKYHFIIQYHSAILNYEFVRSMYSNLIYILLLYFLDSCTHSTLGCPTSYSKSGLEKLFFFLGIKLSFPQFYEFLCTKWHIFPQNSKIALKILTFPRKELLKFTIFPPSSKPFVTTFKIHKVSLKWLILTV